MFVGSELDTIDSHLLFSLTRSEVSRGSMSMSLSLSSPRASRMSPAAESASAPAIALKQVTLEVTERKIRSKQNQTKIK